MSIVIYDDQCVFCSRVVSKLAKPQKIGLSDPIAKVELRKHGVQFINKNTIYYLNADDVYTKSHAIFQIAKQESFPLNIISLGRFLPKRFTDWFYDWVARNRYKIK